MCVHGSWVSPVGVVTRARTRSWFDSPSRVEVLLFSIMPRPALGAHPASYLVGPGRGGGKSDRGMKLATHHNRGSRLRMGGVLPLPTPYIFVACTGAALCDTCKVIQRIHHGWLGWVIKCWEVSARCYVIQWSHHRWLGCLVILSARHFSTCSIGWLTGWYYSVTCQ